MSEPYANRKGVFMRLFNYRSRTSQKTVSFTAESGMVLLIVVCIMVILGLTGHQDLARDFLNAVIQSFAVKHIAK